MSIRYLSQISTAAPIFQLYIYFRQNLEENVTFTFFFLVLPQISLVKYYETIKILMQIFVYFKLHFHNEGLDCEKNYFEMFFCDWPLLSSWKISALTVQPFTFFYKKNGIFLLYSWGKYFSYKIFTVLHQSKKSYLSWTKNEHKLSNYFQKISTPNCNGGLHSALFLLSQEFGVAINWQ